MRIGALKWFVAGLAAVMLQPASVAREQSRPCPADLDAIATCYSGQDDNGAWYLATIPKKWNRILVVHAHGGPRLGQPKADDSDEDLERFQIMSGKVMPGSVRLTGGAAMVFEWLRPTSRTVAQFSRSALASRA